MNDQILVELYEDGQCWTYKTSRTTDNWLWCSHSRRNEFQISQESSCMLKTKWICGLPYGMPIIMPVIGEIIIFF